MWGQGMTQQYFERERGSTEVERQWCLVLVSYSHWLLSLGCFFSLSSHLNTCKATPGIEEFIAKEAGGEGKSFGTS